jgi:GNAT superfamily N-acetyltransferase
MSRVRRAVPRDLEALLALHARFCAIDGHPFDEGRATAAFDPLLPDDRHGVVWMTDDASAYAVVTWGWSIEGGGAEAVLDEIYVDERGRGTGTALIAHLLADARHRGLARVFLETESANDRVRTFYARHGFVADDSIWMSHPFVDLG